MSSRVRNGLNRVRYAGYDFDTHLDELLVRLQLKYGEDYNDFAAASGGMMLADLQAYGQDTNSFYIDRRASDLYLSTARTRRSVARLTRQLGYKMAGAVAASTDLQVSVSTVLSIDVELPRGFQWQAPNSLIFELPEAVVFTAAEQVAGTVKDVPISEGETVSESFVSTGAQNQTFELRAVPENKYPAAGTVRCLVDGASWTEQDFLEYGETNQFETAFNDDPPTIRFGNGVVGNIPSKNASITLTYLATSGKKGEAAQGSITTPVTPLVVAGQTVTLSASNRARAGGGDDPETLEHAQAFAGRVWNSRGKVVTGPDYLAVAGSFASPLFGRVAVSQAISSRSAAQDLFLQAQLSTVINGLAPAVATLRAQVTAAADSADLSTTLSRMTLALGTDAAQARGAATAVAASVDVINGSVEASLGALRALRNTTFEVDAQTTAGIAAVDASGLDPPESTVINSYFTGIAAMSSTLRASIEAVLAVLGAVQDETGKIGATTTAVQTDGTDSYVKIITDQAVLVLSLVGTDDVDPTLATGLYGVFNNTIATVADDLDTEMFENTATDIATALREIAAHVDRMLAADCQANLVSVPILARDAAGFYIGPSLALIDALQTRLEADKEVTHTVRVLSGVSFLRFPRLVVRVGVQGKVSLDQTRAATEAVVDGVLRARQFGRSLYESDLSTPIKTIAGVGFVNVTIAGYTTATSSEVQTDKLDANGNLIIGLGEVITKAPGSVTVTVEAMVSTLVQETG